MSVLPSLSPHSTGTDPDADEVIHVVLVGGPSDLPDHVRALRDPVDEDKIKLPHRDGYEHFERQEMSSGPAVFAWTGRTRIAE